MNDSLKEHIEADNKAYNKIKKIGHFPQGLENGSVCVFLKSGGVFEAKNYIEALQKIEALNDIEKFAKEFLI
jgi:hypothetical protein